MDTVNPPPAACIRVFDMVAQGTINDGLGVATARHVDMPLSELTRLTILLGVDGLQVLTLYLEHLEHVAGPDGQPCLGVPDFSARWVQATAGERAARLGLPPLGRNAAQRGHKAVEAARLLHALANPTTAGGRGRTFRAVLNPRLILIQGGRDLEVSELPRVARGRIPGSRAEVTRAVPVSRNLGNWDSGSQTPFSRNPGNWENGPDSHFPGFRESGEETGVFPQVSPSSPGSGKLGSARPTSSESVGVISLLSRGGEPGTIRSALVPALIQDRARVVARLYRLFNVPAVAERATSLVEAWGLPAAATSRPRVLADWVADTLLGQRDVVRDLTAVNVQGEFVLDRDTLAEHLVVGVLAGLGMRKVSSWGAWLFSATRPVFDPKHNDILVGFVKEIATLSQRPAADDSAAGLASRDVTPSPERASAAAVPGSSLPVGLDDGREDPPAAAASEEVSSAPALGPVTASTPAPRAEEPAGGPAESEGLLDADFVERHLDAARAAFPMFCRPGSRAESDPVARSRVVRMYLTAEGMSLEQADQRVSSRPSVSPGPGDTEASAADGAAARAVEKAPRGRGRSSRASGSNPARRAPYGEGDARAAAG